MIKYNSKYIKEGAVMKIDNSAWLTLFDNHFDRTKYLYHYTDVTKAFKIIDGNSLKFSKTSRANDTLESKLKIDMNSIEKQGQVNLLKWIDAFNSNYSKNLQLLCFSMDKEIPLQGNNKCDIKTQLSDYSGRGFAMPRMWAQYANNNLGVCLVYEREKISKLIKQRLGSLLIQEAEVLYKDQLFKYKFDEETIQEILMLSHKNTLSAGFHIQCHGFLKTHESFRLYNYFYKLDDWSGENEYRFLAFDEDDLFINNCNDALVGVIIGEKMDSTNERILCLLCDDLCEIKRITFTISGCRLINIHN